MPPRSARADEPIDDVPAFCCLFALALGVTIFGTSVASAGHCLLVLTATRTFPSRARALAFLLRRYMSTLVSPLRRPPLQRGRMP